MTPEEVFAQLRDIHTPAVAAADAAGYDFRPLLIFAALSLGAVLFRFFRKRGRARRLLQLIDASAPQGDQRDAMVRLVAGHGRRADGDPAPEAAFQPPGALTDDGVSRLRRWVGRRL